MRLSFMGSAKYVLKNHNNMNTSFYIFLLPSLFLITGSLAFAHR